MSQPEIPSGSIHSEFASDAEMLELVQEFVGELPQRIEELNDAWHEADSESLERLAHQLKGASAGYGFGVLGEAAARLEATIKAADRDLSAVASEFDELVNLCARATA